MTEDGPKPNDYRGLTGQEVFDLIMNVSSEAGKDTYAFMDRMATLKQETIKSGKNWTVEMGLAIAEGMPSSNIPIAVEAIKGWANRTEGHPIWAPAVAMHGVAPHDQWDREAYEKWLDQGGVMDDGSDPPPYEEYWKKKMDNKDGPGLDPADPRYSYRTLSMGDGVVRPNAETKALSEKLQQEALDKRGRKSALDPLRRYFTSED